MCPYAGCNAHPAATRPRPRPHGPSKDARSPDVLRTSRHGSLIPSLILHAPVAFSSPHVSDTRRLLPLSQMGPPGVATCSCAPTSKRYSRIQTSSPHRVWPLHVQVCAPFTYGQFSKVSPVFICGRQMQRAAQLWPPPPTSSYYPPPDSRPRPRRGPSSLDGLHRPRCSPTSSCASPTLGATPSRLQAPQPLPALPAAAPPIPAVPPSCASPLPQMCTLPAPPHSPTRPGAASTSHNAPRRGPARPLLPGCPARPPASLPAVPRAATPTESPFSRWSLLNPEQQWLEAVSQRALREGSPHFIPFPGRLTTGRLQLPASSSQRRLGRRPAPPLDSAPPPPAEVCARSRWREFGTAGLLRARRSAQRRAGLARGKWHPSCGASGLLNSARVGNSGLQLSPSRSAAKERTWGQAGVAGSALRRGVRGLRAAGGGGTASVRGSGLGRR